MKPHVLLIDNYDSFTHNLAQALMVQGARVAVHRNDALTVDEALASQPTHLLISPGPGRPESAGISMALIAAALGRLPILGVCLGHQALAAVLGGTVRPARQLMHGEASRIRHDGQGLFAGLPAPLLAGRYHSLAVCDLPETLAVSAVAEDGEVMAIRHRHLPAVGVQFHPESMLTPDGPALLDNFLEMTCTHC